MFLLRKLPFRTRLILLYIWNIGQKIVQILETLLQEEEAGITGKLSSFVIKLENRDVNGTCPTPRQLLIRLFLNKRETPQKFDPYLINIEYIMYIKVFQILLGTWVTVSRLQSNELF